MSLRRLFQGFLSDFILPLVDVVVLALLCLTLVVAMYLAYDLYLA